VISLIRFHARDVRIRVRVRVSRNTSSSSSEPNNRIIHYIGQRVKIGLSSYISGEFVLQKFVELIETYAINLEV